MDNDTYAISEEKRRYEAKDIQNRYQHLTAGSGPLYFGMLFAVGILAIYTSRGCTMENVIDQLLQTDEKIK